MSQLLNSVHELLPWPRSPSPSALRTASPSSTYRTTSPSANSAIAPLSSTVLYNRRPETYASRHDDIADELRALQRRERDIQARLQGLLDAQAEGLVEGAQGGLNDESAGSRTPTASSVRSTSVSSSRGEALSPARQKKTSLRGARRGIWKAIRELGAVKRAEEDILHYEARQNGELLRNIQMWEGKQQGLHTEMKTISESSRGRRAEELRREADEVDVEIRKTEETLSRLKLRHRRITAELDETQNAVDAKLSSYQASLQMLEADIRKFLSRPPPYSIATRGKGKGETVWQLPPKRRTLEMAKEYWTDEQSALEQQRVNLEMEKDALKEGAAVWNGVVQRVSDFETLLRDEMQKMNTTQPSTSSMNGNTEGMAKVLECMDAVLHDTEQNFQVAEEREWKLLICAIGAELEAFSQGREVLRAALGISDAEESDSTTETDAMNRQLDRLLAEERDGESGLLDVSRPTVPSVPTTGEGKGKGRANNWRRVVDDEDDGPDPELLISHQDTDDE